MSSSSYSAHKSTTTKRIKHSTQERLPSPSPSSSSIQIPKKPHLKFFKSFTQHQSQHLRAKQWKVHSFQLDEFDYHFKPAFTSASSSLTSNFQFNNTLYSIKSFKKSLKNLKKLKFTPRTQQNIPLYTLLLKSWRLDHLQLENFDSVPNMKILIKSIHPRLKSCLYVPAYNASAQNSDSLAKLVSSFRCLLECQLWVHQPINNIKLLINTKFLGSFQKYASLSVIDPSSFSAILNSQILINSSKCLKQIHLSIFDNPEFGIDKTPNFPSLPNLETLSLTWHSCTRQDIYSAGDFAFLKNCYKLKSLSLNITNRKIDSLDYLANFSSLKQLNLSFTMRTQQQNLNLPFLTHLEILSLHSQTSIFYIEGIKKLLSENKNLKSLHLGLRIKDILAVFKNRLDFPRIQSISLSVTDNEKLELQHITSFGNLLKDFHFLKRLFLEFRQSTSELNTVLFQNIAFLNLKEFKLSYRAIGEPPSLQEEKFKTLHHFFCKNSDSLKSIDLDLCLDQITSKEFSNILDGLIHTRRLKRLFLKTNVPSISAMTFSKLINFIKSFRILGSIDIEILGITNKQNMQLRHVLKTE